ncbi:hypothetical protein ACSW8S_11480 [Clostridium perfringens]
MIEISWIFYIINKKLYIYGRTVINDDIYIRLKEICEYISPKYNITLEEWNYD